MDTNTNPIHHSPHHPPIDRSPTGGRRSRRLLAAAAGVVAALAAVPAVDSSPVQAVGNPVLLVHGFSATGGHDCAGYWATMKSYLQNQGRTVYTVGYYGGNTNCDFEVYQNSNNTTDTSLERLGYEFARFVRDEFTNDGVNVDIVAHSMGGLVVRDALDDQPSYLRADHVVTLGSPHAGAQAANLVNVFSLGTCAWVRQCADMTSGSAFLDGLERNPQSAVPTRWTLIGSARDEVIGPVSGTSMSNGSTSKPAVARYTYPTSHRSDSNCYGFEPVTHNDVKENVAIGWCSWPWVGPPTYHSVKNPARRTWDAIS